MTLGDATEAPERSGGGDGAPCVLVTGASSGIGEALAHEFARRGWRMLLCARRVAELERVAAACRARNAACAVHVEQVDVAREADCKRVAERAGALFGGRLDMLVLNAGIGQRGMVRDIVDTGVYRRMLDVNVLGAVYVAHYCLPLLSAAPAKGHSGSTDGRGGRIVVMSSASGLFGFPKLAPYCMSKAALYGFFDALRNEGTPVTVVAPGFVDTDMPSKNVGVDGKPVGDAGHAGRGHPWPADLVAARTIQAALDGERDVVFDLSVRAAMCLRHVFPSLLDGIFRRRFAKL